MTHVNAGSLRAAGGGRIGRAWSPRQRSLNEALDQPRGIGMAGMGQKLGERPSLDRAPALQDQQVVA